MYLIQSLIRKIQYQRNYEQELFFFLSSSTKRLTRYVHVFFLFFFSSFIFFADQGVEKFKAEALTYFHQSFGHLIDFVQRKVHTQHFSVVGLVVVVVLKDREKLISYFFYSSLPPDTIT